VTRLIQDPSKNSPAVQVIEDLIDRYTDNLMRGAFSLGFPDTEAEELVQATFVAFIEGYARFQNRSQVLTYLFGILYNKARETRRLHNRHVSIDAAVEAAFDSHFDSEAHWDKPSMESMTEVEKKAQTSAIDRLLQECMEGLSTAMRMAFTLKEVEGVLLMTSARLSI